MKRFVTQGNDLFSAVEGESIAVPADIAHHVFDVMRMGTGDTLEIADTHGHLANVRIRRDGSAEILSAGSMARIERQFGIVLCMPLIKWPRFEWALEKATELGVSKLIPVECDRSVVKTGEWEKKAERLEKILVEATRQSRNPSAPKLLRPVRLHNLRTVWAGTLFFAHPGPYPSLHSLIPRLKGEIAFVAGPEGGFSPKEVEFLAAEGEAISLGPSILRAETACVTVAALLAGTEYTLKNDNESIPPEPEC